MMKSFRSFLTAVAGALLLLGLINGANAATCTAISTITDPDATLSNSGPCGVGILDDANDSEADVRTVTGDNNWTIVGSVGSPLYLTFTGTTGGDWFIDVSAPADTDFLIVIKDGAAGGNPSRPPPDSVSWVWFDVDTSIACADINYDYCGKWTMYGEGGTIKDISHMSLYSQAGADEIVTPVPEPGTLVLLGVALIGLAIARRKLQA